MAEPLKNLFNPTMIALMGDHLHRAWKTFDRARFIEIASHNLENLELKERGNQIKTALQDCLPDDFKKVAKIINASLHPEVSVELSSNEMDDGGIRGWGIMPLNQYVGEHGLDNFDLAMSVQKELTKRFTAEFGIRYLILHDPERALKTLTRWARDENYHVRRLVSEGSRPRLPWAMSLPEFIKDPTPLIPLLEMLRDDPIEYVRRSVANNLNDIAKDHPDVVATIAKKWMKGASPERKKLIRHACRTLIKQGHAATLSALGYNPPNVTLQNFEILTPTVQFGEPLRFKMSLMSDSRTDQDLIVDYVIHHRKANGKTSPKVFKWKTLNLSAGREHQADKKHPIKPITTRVYYGGLHHVEIVANGICLGMADFELIMPD